MKLSQLNPDKPIRYTKAGRPVYRTPAGNLIAGEPEPGKAKADTVVCGECRHWRADQTGDGGGIGTCKLADPRNPPVPPCFPRAQRHCGVFSQKLSGEGER